MIYFKTSFRVRKLVVQVLGLTNLTVKDETAAIAALSSRAIDRVRLFFNMDIGKYI